jgi:hypothetical protein
MCLVLLQLVLAIGLGVGFAVAASDFGAPSAVVTPLLAIGVVIGVLNFWLDVRDPERSFAIRWLRRKESQQ